MRYLKNVINYFNFTSYQWITVLDKHQKTINISGKPTSRTIAFSLAFILFWSGWIIMFYGFSSISIKYYYTTEEILKNMGMILLSALIATILVFIESKYIFKKNEGKPKNINIYQRELPSKLKPTHVRMLLNDGLIDETSIAATLLDLIDNGYLEISRTNNKLDIFNDGNIVLTKTNKNQNNLLEYEKFLIQWFIDDCGNGHSITSNELKMALSLNKQNKYNPSYLFDYFQALAFISFPMDKYYKKRNVIKNKINSTIFLLGTLIFIGSVILNTIFELNILIIIIGLFLFVYGFGTTFLASPKYLFSKEGVEEEDKWLDLKRYLNEFSDIKNKTPEMIILWDYYLTYSVALGIDGITSNEIKSFFGEEIYNTNIETQDEQYKSNNLTINNIIEQNIQQEKLKYEKIIGLK